MASQLLLKRPKRIGEEDEDELLQFQEEFLKSRESDQPAAKVVRTQRPETETSQQHNAQGSKEAAETTIKEKHVKMDIDFESDNVALASVLMDIVERSGSKLNAPHGPNCDNIPKIEKIDLAGLSTTGAREAHRNKSLFAQNLEKQGKLRAFYPLSNVQQPTDLRHSAVLQRIEKSCAQLSIQDKTSEVTATRQRIVTGVSLGNSNDADQIHLENLQKLAAMQPSEILNEQAKLIKQLDPKLVAFIRKRGEAKANDVVGTQPMDTVPAKQPPIHDEEKLFDELLPMEGGNKRWRNMGKIEYDKLEWMLRRDQQAPTIDAGSSRPARFDFTGKLMTPQESEQVPVSAALHHHGAEPDAAGYTLDELFHLARSSFPQQRVIALQTLGNIVARCHAGDFHEMIKAGETKANGRETERDDDEKSRDDPHNILNQLVEGGLVFLLRWNLDDQTESIINASLNALKNLLQPTHQESQLDMTFDWYKGYEVCCLHPFSAAFDANEMALSLDKQLNVSERKELSELADDEFVVQDLVRGLLRMNLLARFLYLTETYRPAQHAYLIQASMLLVLTRCARHSSEICYELIDKYAPLIDVLVSHLLPATATEMIGQMQVRSATAMLKLLRLLASAGPNTATKLYSKYDLKQRLISYLGAENYLKQISGADYQHLQVETIRLLKVLSAYGKRQIAVDCITDCFEVILRLMSDAIVTCSQLEPAADATLLLQALIALFDVFLTSSSEEDPNMRIKFDMCSSVFSLVRTFLVQQFRQFFAAETPDFVQMQLLAVCLHFTAVFLERTTALASLHFEMKQSSHDTSTRKQTIDDLITALIMPLTNDIQFAHKFDRFMLSHLLNCSTSSKDASLQSSFAKVLGNNLSYLPTAQLCVDTESVMHAPFHFLSGYLRLYLLCIKLNMRSVDDASFSGTRRLLRNPYLISYFRHFIGNNSQAKESLNNNYLMMRYECFFVYHCCKLATSVFAFEDDECVQPKFDELVGQTEDDSEQSGAELRKFRERFDEKRLFFALSLNLLLKLKHGDAFFAQDLFATCIFDMNVWSMLRSVSAANEARTRSFTDSLLRTGTTSVSNVLIRYFDDMKINECTNPTTELKLRIGQDSVKITGDWIAQLEATQIYECLHQIKCTYLESEWLKSASSKVTLFASTLYTNRFLVKPDWAYMPIMASLRKQEMRLLKPGVLPKTVQQQQDEATCFLTTVLHALKFIYLLEVYFGEYVDQNVAAKMRYQRLLCIYLFEPDVFMDRQVATYLCLLLLKYVKDRRRPLENLDLNAPIEGILSFYDFWQHLLVHYDATSFGDYLFSMFLVLPLQQRMPVKYRQLFWSDYVHVFKYARFSDETTPLLVPLINFIQPSEKSLSMIRIYSQVLLDPTDCEVIMHSSLAYTIVIAHINAFIFEHTNALENRVEFEFKQLLANKFSTINNQQLKHDLFHFKCVNVNTQRMEFYAELPSMRAHWLTQLASTVLPPKCLA